MRYIFNKVKVKMKISKKLKKKILEAAQNSFSDVINEFFDEDEMKSNPETWMLDTKERFDLLCELLHKIEVKIEEIIEND